MNLTIRAVLLLTLSYFIMAPAAGQTTRPRRVSPPAQSYAPPEASIPESAAGPEAPANIEAQPTAARQRSGRRGRAHHAARRSGHARRSARGAGESANASSDDHYTNVDGERVHRPVFRSTAPAGASAQCRDGSYSFSRHRSGTCSHHGGVARWL